MGRPKLSTPERKKRKAARLAQWRATIPLFSGPATPAPESLPTTHASPILPAASPKQEEHSQDAAIDWDYDNEDSREGARGSLDQSRESDDIAGVTYMEDTDEEDVLASHPNDDESLTKSQDTGHYSPLLSPPLLATGPVPRWQLRSRQITPEILAIKQASSSEDVLSSDYAPSTCIEESDSEVEHIGGEETTIEAGMAAHLVGITLDDTPNQAGAKCQIDLAQELGKHIIHFTGCGSEAHSATSREHLAAFQEATHSPHITLSQYSLAQAEYQIPSVIDQPQPLSYEQRENLSPPNWAPAFEGLSSVPHQDGPEQEPNRHQSGGSLLAGQGQKPNHLCLACSQTEQRSMAVRFDIDSVLGFAQSLAFAREGLDINFFPRFHTNIQNDLHTYTTLSYDFGKGEKLIQRKIHQVPHYRLGRLLGREDITVYILFPRMYDPQKPTNFPGKGGGSAGNLLRTWTDQIFLPALFRHVHPTSRQHYPTSWEHARQKAEARYAELRGQIETDPVHTQARSMHYPISPDCLSALWQDIEQQLLLPQNAIYGQPQIFFTGKNSKLQFPRTTLSNTWEAFNRSFSTAFDFQYLNRSTVWVDLGKELTGCDFSLPSQETGADSRPTTYLFKSCCAATLSRWVAFEQAGRPVIATQYSTAMLRDAASTTLETSRSSYQRQEGLSYIQVYNSIKEPYDAGKTKPFGSPFLYKLAWDSEIAGVLQKASGGNPTPIHLVLKGYIEGKHRLYNALTEAKRISYGVRMEYRMSLALMDRVEGSLQDSGDWDSVPVLTSADLEPIWHLSTDEYTTYQLANANKFMAAIEWIRALSVEGRISYEHCKILAMFLQALPLSYDCGSLQQQPALGKAKFRRRDIRQNTRYLVPTQQQAELWEAFTRHHRHRRDVLGMGLQDTLLGSGYAWLLPRIDWEQLVFRPEFADNIAYASSMLQDTYRKNWARVKDTKDDFGRLEAAGKWLSFYQKHPASKEFLLQFMILIVLRAYRKEVFNFIKAHITQLAISAASRGEITFCQHEIRRILVPDSLDIHIVNSKRSSIHSVTDLVKLLWGFDDGQRRDRWGSASFRLLCQRAISLVRQWCGQSESDAFHDRIGLDFIATHWLFPYPTPTKFYQRNHHKKPLWVAVYHQDLIDLESIQGQGITINRIKGDNQPRLLDEWNLCASGTAPQIEAIPLDYSNPQLHSQADLQTTQAYLETEWEAWQQLGGEESVRGG